MCIQHELIFGCRTNVVHVYNIAIIGMYGAFSKLVQQLQEALMLGYMATKQGHHATLCDPVIRHEYIPNTCFHSIWGLYVVYNFICTLLYLYHAGYIIKKIITTGASTIYPFSQSWCLLLWTQTVMMARRLSLRALTMKPQYNLPKPNPNKPNIG